MKMLKQYFAMLIGAAVIGLYPLAPAIADVTELNVLGPDRSFPRVSRAYPDMDATFVREGTPRTVAQVRRVAIGSTKLQLVKAVGQPVSAYRDGSWNFNVSFRLPQGNRLICQYRVYFDADDKVAGTVWRRPQCQNIVLGKVN
ncbi:outer membrane protein assembly factor BamE [Sulfitobacter sp. F26169L]|uniref:outer membrane protein assembly factor BamE domain-containing protein n=1 Tax=Sulfitobacter sp. F26169L TaxID=2996015 RepID=UPI002260F21E|nr:outer membrane protein assembly factor BamE [Sulfitobacter sp. F26169L]MCX7566526.1 outer membrane protein assembly factor BamE [Sulfitobacter sp. F26169L]